MSDPVSGLDILLKEIRGCTLCAEHLPLGPRPVIRAQATARILIIGQAPGTKVHETGVPWDDPSGERLREWMGLDPEKFYDETKIAIMPTGFCYPGKYPKGGDLPPRPECARTWHEPVLSHLRQIELTLLVGGYAQATYFGPNHIHNVTETVSKWREYMPKIIPTPHPSWRTKNWVKKNSFFETDIIPHLRDRVSDLLSDG